MRNPVAKKNTANARSNGTATHGNARDAKWNSPPAHTMSNHSQLRKSSIQPKLKIGSPNSKYEREADRIAEQVVSSSNHSSLQRSQADRSQRGAIDKHSWQTSNLPESIDKVTNSGRGRPLETSTRKFMESKFGRYSFKHVRIHTDSNAAESAAAVEAKAYTSGRHLVFSKGNYSPQTVEGKQLLAHELTHVIQQGAATLRKTSRRIIVGSNAQRNLWGEQLIKRTNLFASEQTNGTIIQLQGGAAKGWNPCNMPGKRTNLDAQFLTRLDNICGRMGALGYKTKIWWGFRSINDQIQLYAQGRTFNQLKVALLAAVNTGLVTAANAQKWINFYDPNVGGNPIPQGPQVTWTLNSRHLSGKAADVAHPTQGWFPAAGAKYWKALKTAAQAEGLQIGPPANDLAHVQVP